MPGEERSDSDTMVDVSDYESHSVVEISGHGSSSPVSSSLLPPGRCNDPPWMFIENDQNGNRKTYGLNVGRPVPEGTFHRLSREEGGLMCRSVCLEGSECEQRLIIIFVFNAGQVCCRGGEDFGRKMVQTVIGKIESGSLDKYGRTNTRPNSSSEVIQAVRRDLLDRIERLFCGRGFHGENATDCTELFYKSLFGIARLSSICVAILFLEALAGCLSTEANP